MIAAEACKSTDGAADTVLVVASEKRFPIEPGCGCHACTSGYSRSYLRHLDRCNEMLAPMLGTLHNLFYYEKLMADIRAAIEAGTFLAFRESFYAARGAVAPPL